ncbi:general amidase GmdA, putative [Talaromyces stipitatus ATCC 10500]|uniref:amidase n=1 Tax=Talaromyces stipitatus (strain ATCC 10500 / CBS 375.48 / QM 6759 / NRRL 1006) TaxID=441959 RepID=B8MI05_TALSN|nr:general amidase GmdA, putative [Talaromyces stipitatus ATCC 10500]EED17167.1 general amidase GmdA, putative [Talaromyces stipitatus ATCC 10500]
MDTMTKKQSAAQSLWQQAARTKRDSVNSLIPEAWRLPSIPSSNDQKDVTGIYIWQFLSAKEIEITETDACGIVSRTSSGAWKAREVAEAFSHRAALAHQLTNCLHEIFFDAALDEAQAQDDYFAMHKRPIGPLHGLPVSLKDQFHVKGVETTMGYVGWIGTFEGRRGSGNELIYESEMVRELRSLGAILYCKTSVPHTLMAGETVNNIIGYTWNPKNRLLSAGGSSGGEGALIGLKGSPVGFGTDIGGSIRIPAAFNGLYGLRPSAGRLPYEGMANSMDGQNSVLSVVGPLATSVASLKLLVKSLLSQEPWLHDPLVLELPWRDTSDLSQSQLTFGILKDDGVVRPHPPVIRAIDMVVDAIKRAGHQVIEWSPPSHTEGTRLVDEIYVLDGGHDVHSAFRLSGEIIADQVAAMYGKEPVAEKSASSIAAINVKKRNYQRKYLEYWNSTSGMTGTGRPVDAFIMPVAPFAAARPKLYNYYGYSTIINILDYATCTVPVTLVDKDIDKSDANYEPRNKVDEIAWRSCEITNHLSLDWLPLTINNCL